MRQCPSSQSQFVVKQRMRLYEKCWQLLTVLFLLVGLAYRQEFALAESQASSSARSKDTLFFVPHTHWEGAVFKTREEFLQMGLPNILRALSMMKRYPTYKFVLDQVAYVKPFLERYPEEEPAFRKFIAEGRLQIVGGMDIMPDDNMPSGESFVRQLLYGKGYYREKLGVEVTVGWLLDTFGHHAQMPQILKLAGLKSFWFFRGVASLQVPSEFHWEGLDGSRIPAFWLPYGYGAFYGSPANFPEFEGFFRRGYESLRPFSRGPGRVGLAGADVSEPEEHVPDQVERFNKTSDAPFNIKIAVPTEFEAEVAKRAEHPVIKGELNPIFQGIYSSRIEVKHWYRKLGVLLGDAEKLGSLASALGFPGDRKALWRAWEPVLFNVTHDLASGVMVDKVFEDTIRGYEFSKRLVDEMIESELDRISSKIDTSGEGVPVVVFNTLGWSRTDATQVEVGFSESEALDVALTDASGQAVPVQLSEVERYGDGGIRRAKLGFVARDVPALGYSVFRAHPRKNLESSKSTAGNSADYDFVGWSNSAAQQDSKSIENEHYRATFNLWTGELTSLRVKSGNWEALSGPANVVAREQDGGDFWELYGTLHGARNIAMIKKQGPPDRAKALLSSEYVGGSGTVRSGPVFSEYSVSHPFGTGMFVTSARLYNGVPRLEITTEILNNEKFVRYRAAFPTSIQNGQNVHEIPFGAIERPIGVEMPAQNWIDYGDGSRGVALLNRGQPGNNVADGTLLLSLMRSARMNAYGFGGGYEPGVSSDGGLDVGKTLTFHYALAPHNGDWRDAGVVRAGLEFNAPLITRKAGIHTGTLPPRWGFLEVSHANVVVSALKPGPEGSVILRVYEAGGKSSAGVRIKFTAKLADAEESNLMEDGGRKLAAQNGSLQFDLGAFEIKTIKLQLQAAR